MAEDNNTKSKIAEREEEILKFWQENKIFEKSLEKEAPNGNFVFFDGPPFATGLPHYGHILPGTIKDVIPRYQTMRGKKVARKWGWDCHGLPIENLIEKELGLSSKKEIENYGVGKFNMAARKAVMRYADEWKKIIPRSGRFVDMEDDYKTMDTSYTESVWWAFKNLYDKGLVYKSFKSMHLCPHCETTLSNFEVNQGYKDITDISVTVEFALNDEENTFVLAWTTTPWTLPGNVALAVGPEIEYVCIEKKDGGQGKPIRFILAKEALERVFKNDDYKIVKTYIGKDLVGKSYKPLFDYYVNDEKLENRGNGWKIYGADFVTTTDGTGVVHIAPAFGEDDMNLGKEENLPFIQHVKVDGTFKNEVTDFMGQKVKPKEDHQKVDVEIIKYLAKAGTLFEKEKYIHSYPHCWRCETPLLNYATTSWFVKVSQIKDKMVEINNNISWTPKEIGEGRFGKWLEGARDWAISRSRYWGAPLPVWEDDDKNLFVLGSIDDLKKHTKKSGNKYFVMRHGEADHNVKNICSSDRDFPHHLTKKGEEQAIEAGKKLKNKKIDAIYCSPFIRTRETAKLIAKEIGFDENKIIFDDRIVEFGFGDFNSKPYIDFLKYDETNIKNYADRFPNGESYQDSKNRIGDFMYDIDSKHKEENILVVTHGIFHEVLPAILEGADAKRSKYLIDTISPEIGEFYEYSFVPLPHNENYELDLHRPYIDEINLVSESGKPLKRVAEVFDCWFESGSMSFAQYHYPFENKEEFESKNSCIFPANFIAEGLDQTRGWFYTMLVLGTGLFGKSPFDSVVVNGMILAEDGRKMSKSLNNYPDPVSIMDEYGADSLRYYLMSSPAVKAEDLNFSERGVEEVSKKVILKLENVLSFYEMYPVSIKGEIKETILDKWIVSRLNSLLETVSFSLENYELDKASRPILDFVDDLSVWYVRRSRDRLKSADINISYTASNYLKFVLTELSKIIAPFMPFLAEEIYKRVDGQKESVHLEDWPKQSSKINGTLFEDMNTIRGIVTSALEFRQKSGIKVRQPLNSMKIKSKKFEIEYEEILKDELNVKEVIFDENLETEVWLDTEITPELQKEGNVRGFIRAIQELRKNKNLMPSDAVELLVETDELGKEFLNSVLEDIKKPTNVSKIDFEENDGEELKIGDLIFKIMIK